MSGVVVGKIAGLRLGPRLRGGRTRRRGPKNSPGWVSRSDIATFADHLSAATPWGDPLKSSDLGP